MNLVIAEDQSMLLSALATLLTLEDDINVVAQASNGRLALEQVREHKPDILLTDIEMPEMTGLELAEAIKQEGLACKIIIITTFARTGYLRRALEAGASGYLLKDSPTK